MDEDKIDSEVLLKKQQSNNFEYHKNQASHNFRLAQSLFAQSEEDVKPTELFLDWVVTTCFYSGLHFVSAELIFKGEVALYENLIHFDNIEAVARRLKKREKLSLPKETVLGRHETLKRLVKDNFPESVQLSYNRLYSDAKISRYQRFPWDDKLNASSCLSACKKIEIWFNSLHLSS